MLHFDNSHEGNECWFNEHWYWLPQFMAVVRVVSVDSRWAPSPPESTLFTAPNQDMPESVQMWFAGDREERGE